MARGKVKSKGKGFRNFNKNKKHSRVHKSKSRKRDSSQIQNSVKGIDGDMKRDDKRRKVPEQTVDISEQQDDFSEGEDQFKQLLSTFSNRYSTSQKKAVESDSSEEDSEDEVKNSVRELKSDDEDDSSSESESKTDNESLDMNQEEEIDDTCDPFVCHLNYDLEDCMLEAAQNLPQSAERILQHWPVLGQFCVYLPKADKEHRVVKPLPKISLEGEKQCAKPGTLPQRITNVNWSQLHVKSQIENNISKANIGNLNKNESENISPLTPLQKDIFSIINNYQDLYYPERTFKNGEEIRFIYCFHAVNHIMKTRTKILHHNQKLSDKDDIPEEYRDQGLVRPKVVILVPFKESALRVVKMIMALVVRDDKASITHKKRFFDEFTGNEIEMPKKHPKPEDYEQTFAGNSDDTFRIGLGITKKSLRLYAEFYHADIIVASPLGLRVIIGAEGEEGRDFDFLASIELLVIDQAEIFFMQNWDHLLHILDHFHLQPQEAHDTNFARVRSWALNGWTRYYRQTLLFSSIMLPEFNALMNKRCQNYAGKIFVTNPIQIGSICEVVVQVPQVFHRFEAGSVAGAMDARFEFFVKKILSQYKEAVMKHILIYVPSYFDYVRLRNYFKKEDLKFVQICEYSKDNRVMSARDLFFLSKAHMLLYSERFHFFRRPTIKGIQHILFYQPPTFPHFYSEMCNLMREINQPKMLVNDSNMTVTVVYSKYDVQQLAAIVGTERAAKMVSSERNVHMFMTGQ